MIVDNGPAEAGGNDPKIMFWGTMGASMGVQNHARTQCKLTRHSGCR